MRNLEMARETLAQRQSEYAAARLALSVSSPRNHFERLRNVDHAREAMEVAAVRVNDLEKVYAVR